MSSNSQSWKLRRKFLAILFCLGCCFSISSHADNLLQIEYLSRDAFLQQAFPEQQQKAKILRLKNSLKKTVADILGHDYAGRRIRYWQQDNRTAWIIDEIGKDLPITMGLVVEGDAVKFVRILVYREERGGEVHQDFFTRQFESIKLNEQDLLTKKIDGITGATLSVESVTRVARLCLKLHAMQNAS